MKGPLMAKIFDSHTHYMSDTFDENREELIASLPSQNVGAVMDCGVDYKTSLQSLEIGKEYPWFYTAAGIHPQEVATTPFEELKQIETLFSHPKVKAVGECGLDYYWTKDNKEEQMKYFTAQIELSKTYNLPIIMHDRDAHKDMFDTMKKYRPQGVLHCFSGSAESAKEFVKMGLYIGFTGVITFKNARKTVEALAAVPLENLLMETDCPWMAPEPLRGRPSHSGMIKYTAEKAAEIKGVSLEKLLDVTFENACRLFNISAT